MNPETQPIVGDMEPTNQPDHEVPDWQKNIVPGAPAGVVQESTMVDQMPPDQVLSIEPPQQFNQPVVPIVPVSTPMAQAAETSVAPKGSKNYVVTLIFAIFFGYYGFDRFYLGKYITGALKLLTGGGFGLWVLIDIYRTGHGKVKAKDGTALDEYDKYGHIGRPVAKATVIFIVLMIVISLAASAIMAATLSSYDGNLEIESSSVPTTTSSELQNTETQSTTESTLE